VAISASVLVLLGAHLVFNSRELMSDNSPEIFSCSLTVTADLQVGSLLCNGSSGLNVIASSSATCILGCSILITSLAGSVSCMFSRIFGPALTGSGN
jgi:hypothetical protein